VKLLKEQRDFLS